MMRFIYLAFLLASQVAMAQHQNEFDMQRTRESYSQAFLTNRASTVVLLIEKLGAGTPIEKDAVLSVFKDHGIEALIPHVIEAVCDGTIAPTYHDTGWGFVGHHAASALWQVARKFYAAPLKAKDQQKFTFHDDMYKGPDRLRQDGRLMGVRDAWSDWWSKQKPQQQPGT